MLGARGSEKVVGMQLLLLWWCENVPACWQLCIVFCCACGMLPAGVCRDMNALESSVHLAGCCNRLVIGPSGYSRQAKPHTNYPVLVSF
jgi:hypothetical protein